MSFEKFRFIHGSSAPLNGTEPALAQKVTLITDDEIDQYIRGMFWKRCQDESSCTIAYTMTFLHVFADLYHAIHGVANQIPTQQERWFKRLVELRNNSVIRVENYDIKGGILLLKSYNQYTYDKWLVEESVFIKDEHDKCVIRLIHRVCKEQGVLAHHVKISEYGDRYEEEITNEHFENNRNSEVIRQTVWKRDLFREEYHTIPYRQIHNELLYSLDLPLWFENEARRAKKHFETLI